MLAGALGLRAMRWDRTHLHHLGVVCATQRWASQVPVSNVGSMSSARLPLSRMVLRKEQARASAWHANVGRRGARCSPNAQQNGLLHTASRQICKTVSEGQRIASGQPREGLRTSEAAPRPRSPAQSDDESEVHAIRSRDTQRAPSPDRSTPPPATAEHACASDTCYLATSDDEEYAPPG